MLSKMIESVFRWQKSTKSPGKDLIPISDDLPVNSYVECGQALPRKRITSPERWEIRQLVASGAASAADHPDLDLEYHDDANGEGQDGEEDLDIDLDIIEAEPPFLKGQTKKSAQLSPIKVVKAPDGSLNRAPAAGGILASYRRLVRRQQANAEAEEEASTRDISAQWNDPMAAGEKVFAQDLQNTRKTAESRSSPMEAGNLEKRWHPFILEYSVAATESPHLQIPL
jgi:ATP-dependent RNA helicase DHX8/PRP22